MEFICLFGRGSNAAHPQASGPQGQSSRGAGGWGGHSPLDLTQNILENAAGQIKQTSIIKAENSETIKCTTDRKQTKFEIL